LVSFNPRNRRQPSHDASFFLSNYSNDRVAKDIKFEIEKIATKKKFNQGQTKESLLAEKKIELKNYMMNRSSTPRGTLQDVFDILTKEQELDPAFNYVRLRGILSDGVTLTSWKQSVQEGFDTVWQQELQTVASAGPTSNQKRRGRNDNGEEDDSAEQIRTCTTTLRQILRPDLMDKYHEITRISEERQVAMTDTMDELCVLIQKTLLVVS
jgi:hypothetical protein